MSPESFSRCPDRARVRQFLENTLTPKEIHSLQEHFAACAACRLVVEEIEAEMAREFGFAVASRSGEIAERGNDNSPFREPQPAMATISQRDFVVKKATFDFLEPAQEKDEIGRLGPYRILRVLGVGGMGMVFEAEDVGLQRPVALKVIRPELGQSLANRQRFLREARAMALVTSDHVVTIHNVGQANDVCYMAMERLEGEPLDTWLDRLPKPVLSETMRIGREIAIALEAAHRRGVIHRDVKPANVWLEGPSRRVKLLDFGLALPQTTNVNLTGAGAILGTPAYMSPEQARSEVLDNRSDLFSLGCVLYVMVTGRQPFGGETPVAMLTALAVDTPPPPRDFNPGVPIPLSDLILCLLAKKPAERPASAHVVIEALQAIERMTPPPTDILSQSHFPVAAGLSPSTADALRTGKQATPPSQRRAREAERRQVTVLTCNCGLFESEAYLEECDAEDQGRLLQSFQQACEEAVRRFDGTIVQCSQRGLLACFGYPVAHEDSPHRAVRSGLDLLKSLTAIAEPLQRDRQLQLNPWIGIHTGPAVVKTESDGVSLVGEARNVAVGLEEAAAFGEVICSEATHHLIQSRFDCASLGRQKIKGVAQPVELFKVLGIDETQGPTEATGLTPLIGRDHEISLLMDRWEQAKEGIGQVVLLTGEAGLGKSRLVFTLKQQVLEQMVEGEVDAPVIEWRCSPYYQNTGLYPAIDFYERALFFGREEAPEARFERLLQRLEKYDMARPETVPLWASLLSLPTPARFPPLLMPPARQREETFRILLDWLHLRAARRPILFVVEDLHWVDASTLEFLSQVLTEGLNDRILLVLTFRPDFKSTLPAVAQQTSLSLNRLTRRQVGDLMRKQTEHPLPEVLIDQLFERTGGVPLFVEEFAKMVHESAAQAADGSSTQALLAREIPTTLQDLMMARLDRLESDRELAQLAAALGREFSHELLAAAAAMNEELLEAELGKLVQAEILHQKGRPPRRSYIFKHALLQDAAYNTMVKSRRQQVHRKIADTLEASFRQTVETQPELLAHHFGEAGLPEKAVEYCLKAGLRSRQRSAEIEAIGHLTRGLTLLETLPESPERNAKELELLTPLGTAYIASRGYAAPDVGPVFQRARQLCEQAGQPAQLFAMMLGIWEWHIVQGHLRLSMDLANEGMEFARRLNDPGIMMEALFMDAETRLYRADFAGARDSFARAVADFDDRERTRIWADFTSHDAGVTCRSNLAICLWHLGFPDQAFAINREMVQLARTIGHPYSLAYALHHTAWLYQYCRMGKEVQAAAEEELAIANEQRFALWQATGTFFKGTGLLLQGKTEDALPFLLKGNAAFRAGGAELTLTFQLSVLGEAYMRVGRFEEAHKALDEGLALAEKNDERIREAELHRVNGDLYLAESADLVAAEGSFNRAIETARRQHSRGWELQATTALARLRQRQGRGDEGRAALQSIFGTFTEGFTTPDLVDAAALLKTLG